MYVIVPCLNGQPLPGIYLDGENNGTDIPEHAVRFRSLATAAHYLRTYARHDPAWRICGITLEPREACTSPAPSVRTRPTRFASDL